MSSHLSVAQTLELVENLKTTVRDLAARADKLNEERRTQMVRETRRREAAAQEQARELAEALGQAEADYQAAKQSAAAKHQQRKTRIDRAYQAAKEAGLKRIDDQTGGRKYELQKRMLQAERDRETGLASAAAKLAEFKSQLATQQEVLTNLEHAAQGAFRGYGKFRRLFLAAYAKAAPKGSDDEEQLLAELRNLAAQAQTALGAWGKYLFWRIFRYAPFWIILAIGLVGLVPVLQYFGTTSISYPQALAGAGTLMLVVFAIRYLAQRKAEPVARSIADSLAQARQLHDLCLEKADAHYQHETQRLQDEFTTNSGLADQELKRALAQAGEKRVDCRMKCDAKTVRITAKWQELQRARQARREAQHQERIAGLKQAAELRAKALAESSAAKEAEFETLYQEHRRSLEAEWQSKLQPIYQTIASANALSDRLFPPWSPRLWERWRPPERFAHAAKFGRLEVDMAKLSGADLAAKQLLLPGPAQFGLPLCLTFPQQGSILLETAQGGHDEAIGALNNVILRLLSSAPPGRLRFTIIDPVGLGQNFAGVMHMADYEEQIINSRIWTQSGQIEQRLGDLNEHMEKVIQMYLRNEYATIAEYNEQAGVIAEKYHFLVIADFPVNFTDSAAKRLLSIAASGARCGVYMLINWDRRQPLPQEFIPEELRKNSVCLNYQSNSFVLTPSPGPGTSLVLDEAPAPEQAIEFIHRVGQASRDSSRVEVPFSHVAPAENEIWTEDTTNEVRVPIGRTGATKLQYLAIGKGTRQHGLIAGKTGSGKSTLFHVIITNLALWCSPEQAEFYLVDFKKGVEFKCYASRRLPHARVVAIESDREFGLSVLQRIDDELKRRGDLFRKLGVQDIAGYKRAGGTETIPRTLLLVDEFQEFFVEDDKIAQTASLLLDRIVRQGRAFGIHVVLGSQTLGGAYTVARTTLGQMVIRIALQCNEADAYLIMDENNPAPRLLSRPGEGIYNDTAGTLEGNSPFQVVWLPEEVRDAQLQKIRDRADQSPSAYPGPIVFEGNAPADVAENSALEAFLQTEPVKPPAAARMFLGAPNSIKGPTEAVFHRQSGNNLLIVGQREETVLAMFSIGLVALAAQYPPGAPRFIVCDASAPGSAQRTYLERIVQIIPHPITSAKQTELPELLAALGTDMQRRSEDVDAGEAPAVFLFINGLQKFNKLRYEEEFSFSASETDAASNPGALLNTLICEGTRLGFHVIASCDTYNNVNRFLSRKAFSEFEMRVLFQMSANDSASLIDNPKASMLGLHRALYFNAQEGYLETFRPYALPGSDWLERVERHLARWRKHAAVVQQP